MILRSNAKITWHKLRVHSYFRSLKSNILVSPHFFFHQELKSTLFGTNLHFWLPISRWLVNYSLSATCHGYETHASNQNANWFYPIMPGKRNVFCIHKCNSHGSYPHTGSWLTYYWIEANNRIPAVKQYIQYIHKPDVRHCAISHQ